MTRTGKIARLPEHIRQQINHRLQDGENGREIILWLNAHEEVKAILSSDFDASEINDVNLSHWKLGGFRDWEAQQAALAETHRITAEGHELDQAGQKVLADKIAVWLLGRYAVATRKLIENESDPAAWKLLREVCHDLVALRRGDHFAEWLRIDREKLDLQRRRMEREEKTAEKAPEAKSAPVLSDEEKDRRWRQIFGMQPL
jgi:hypothetical protein